jgi:hypothetical protein
LPPGRGLTYDFRNSWKGIVSFEGRFRSRSSEPVLVEIELALAPFRTDRVGSALSFGSRDWTWLTHNLDPYLYVQRGLVRAIGPEAQAEQALRFDFHIGRVIVLYLVSAVLLSAMIVPPYGWVIAGASLLVGLLHMIMLPAIFAAKVERQLGSVNTG